MTKGVIRRMTEKDIDMVHEIEILSFSVPWSKESFIDEVKNENAIYYVYEEDSKVWGFAGMHHIVDEGHITNIAVHPQKRGQGIGRLLLSALISYAKENGLVGLTLEVRSKNYVAISLYKSLGFVQEGIRKNYYSDPPDDAIIMWLWL
ncbi:ribosomal-protein-alanine acetyltransferase [Caldicellulosiruptor obsidiansis OB47]|jgi:ribosomal-protein-alanine N-acetyltransferase|uniref:[Ribosomal protein bS18]-alanine N-acetyltransferase n=1 Tax=Caldicellulosiruptor obsidiansis (strain ATCC BAA-2073 / JCM 16842 / OB47) TaxID=608506 RepID=D9TIA1_CALOO|nr:ribosomal protein S18-alanine N-acetyltransferase [Caldicellulosiruptor obsidiansis]ADL41733.1 ribosomal-protein-alanine acetyltransferase [Caldicellulosiruptor obsidiansis OB47]